MAPFWAPKSTKMGPSSVQDGFSNYFFWKKWIFTKHYVFQRFFVVFGSTWRPKTTQDHPKMAPRWILRVVFSCRILSSIFVRFGSCFGAILAPFWHPFGSQNRSKIRPKLPRSPQEAPRGAKRHPRRPKRHPRASKRHPRAPKRRPRAPKRQPRAPKRHPRAPKRQPRGPKRHPRAPKRQQIF